MSAFTDTLQEASYRGVTFGVLENEGEFGRRGQWHQYPKRDIPFAEDLGRRGRRVRFRAFVLGLDCAAQRDALISAVEQLGPGLLVHPSMTAPLMMEPDPERPCRFTERWDQGRLIEFELSFVEPGQVIYPTSGNDAQAAIRTAAGNAYSASSSGYQTQQANAAGNAADAAEAGTVPEKPFVDSSLNLTSVTGGVPNFTI